MSRGLTKEMEIPIAVGWALPTVMAGWWAMPTLLMG